MTNPDNTGKVTAVRGAKPLTLHIPEVPELDIEQRDAGYRMFAYNNMLLLSDPGAGKTLTALEALMWVEARKRDEGTRAKVLVLCPPIAVYTWVRWGAAMYKDEGYSGHIQVIDTGNRAVTADASMVIVPYSLISRKCDVLFHRLLKWSYDVIICDESDNLTGWDSNRTRAVFGENMAGGLASFAEWKWMLTGTAVPRYNDGLYPVLRNLFPDVLAKHHVKEPKNFLDTFTITERVKFGKMRFAQERVAGSRNNKLLHNLLFGTTDKRTPVLAIRNKLRIGVEALLDFVSFDFPLSKELQELEEELSAPVVGDERVIDPRLNTALRKLGEELAPHAAAHLAEQMKAKRDRHDPRGILVLHWHKSVGNIVTDLLRQEGYTVAQINGSTSPQDDAETERAFNAGEVDFVVGQIKAMGVAINLQDNCNHVAFVEDSFSDAANQQAYQRVYRRGQNDDVTVHFYRAIRSSLVDIRQNVATKKRKGAKIVLDNATEV